MKNYIIMTSILTAALAICARYINPARCIDQVIKLYICQTEHDLTDILASETSNPEKYARATVKGKKSPLDAARDSARITVADEKLRCDADDRVVVERLRVEGDAKSAYMAVLTGPELEKYCPETIKKHGNPCK